MHYRTLFSLAAQASLLAGCAAGDASADGAGGLGGAGGAGGAEAISQAPQAIVPVTGHPRLWLTAADVTRLQGWATPQNPAWKSGLSVALGSALAAYNTQFFPNGQPNPVWPDLGGHDFVAYDTEAYAEMFAFMSLVDPDLTARPAHASRARNLLMHVMNEAVKGVDSSASPAPFRSPQFATFNRANYWSEAFGLTVDWIYPTLSAADKDTIRKVFLRWSAECLVGYAHPVQTGVANDASTLAKGANRWAANNYYAGHARHLLLMSLALDPADDPPVDPQKPVLQLGNSLRSYFANYAGTWLYHQYAVYEDPAVVGAAYGISPAGLGPASGGLPVEGFLYGESLGYLAQTLLALRTAGRADPAVLGPQAQLGTSAFWERFSRGWLSSLAPAPFTPTTPGWSYLGPVYQVATYGDILRDWVSADLAAPLLSLGALDAAGGDLHRLPALRWAATNAVEGGTGALLSRIGAPWGNSNASRSILYFMLLDPTAAAAPDPRPGRPLVFTDAPSGRVLARTDWSPTQSWFTYRCSWLSINHQLGDCNQIELYRNGEWLIKERSGYANDLAAFTSDHHNTLAVQNDHPPGMFWWEAATAARGGQWTNGSSAGDPTVATSAGPGYVFAGADATRLYNRAGGYDPASGASDVLHVSRATVWLKPDRVVVYDRATTKTAGRFKRFHLEVAGAPVVSGARATVTTPRGQLLHVHSLLPAAAIITASPAENFNQVALLNPTTNHIVIEDPAGPSDVRFLTLLQGSDAGGAPDAPTTFKTTLGTAFDGMLVNGTAVLFPVDPKAPFTGTSWTVPATTGAHVVTGLAPGAPYGVSMQPSGAANAVISLAAGGGSFADAAGVLVINGVGAATFGCTPTSNAFPAAGGAGGVTVSTLGNAAWASSSGASWLTVGPGGSGEGTVAYTVAPNTAATPRSGMLTVAGCNVTITQAPAASSSSSSTSSSSSSTSSSSSSSTSSSSSSTSSSSGAPACPFNVSPLVFFAAAGGGTASSWVATNAGCAWTSVSPVPWIKVTAGATVTGSAGAAFSVLANTTSAARSATVTAGGKAIAITQAGASGASPSGTGCTWALSASSAAAPAAGTAAQILSVQAPSACPWTATSNVPWLTVVSGAASAGCATAKYAVAPSAGATRSGTITAAGLTFTVTQSGQ